MSEWRLLDSGCGDAAYNMALDEAISIAVRNGDSPPTLRLYNWQSPSVSLGSFQKTADIDTEFCNSNNIPIVRRPTGGRGILHGDELTYSVSARNEGCFSAGLFETYHIISTALKAALKSMGISVSMKMARESGRQLMRSPICFASTSYGEVSLHGKKLIGSAQRRWSDGFLQQGSVPYSIDYKKLRAVFKSGEEAEREMVGIKEACADFSPALFRQAIRQAFENVFNCDLTESHPSSFEHELAEKLCSEKYLNKEWNHHGIKTTAFPSNVTT